MRPTRTGLGTLIGGAALLLIGLGLRWPELVGLGAAALLLFSIAVVVVVLPSRIAIERQVAPERVERGGTALGQVRAINLGRFTTAAHFAVDGLRDTVEETSLPPIDLDLGRLRPRKASQTGYDLPTMRRGRFEVGPLMLERTDALRLIHTRMPTGGRIAFWVHPKVHLLAPPVSRRPDPREGPTFDSAPRGSVVFHAIREYEVGDDLRLVHWPSTARQIDGQLMVREHVDATQPTVAVLLDTDPSSYASESDFEEAVDVVASFAAAAMLRECAVRVVAGDGTGTQRGSGPSQLDALLDGLSLVRLIGKKSLSALAADVRGQRGITSAVLVTGTGDTSGPAAALRHLDDVRTVMVGPSVPGEPRAPRCVRISTAAELSLVPLQLSRRR